MEIVGDSLDSLLIMLYPALLNRGIHNTATEEKL